MAKQHHVVHYLFSYILPLNFYDIVCNNVCMYLIENIKVNVQYKVIHCVESDVEGHLEYMFEKIICIKK